MYNLIFTITIRLTLLCTYVLSKHISVENTPGVQFPVSKTDGFGKFETRVSKNVFKNCATKTFFFSCGHSSGYTLRTAQ